VGVSPFLNFFDIRVYDTIPIQSFSSIIGYSTVTDGCSAEIPTTLVNHIGDRALSLLSFCSELTTAAPFYKIDFGGPIYGLVEITIIPPWNDGDYATDLGVILS
jgi:hypothetical protein